jgi:hypothetical protein
MGFIKKHLSLWRIVLSIGVAAIAIPVASRVSSTAKAVVEERQDYLEQKTAASNEDAYTKYSKGSEAVVGPRVARPQDDYYDRRREYWDKRIERRLESREEYLDEQTKEDNDADAKDSKAAKDKDSKDAADDEDYADDDNVDKEIERRREYWRQRLEKEW